MQEEQHTIRVQEEQIVIPVSVARPKQHAGDNCRCTDKTKRRRGRKHRHKAGGERNMGVNKQKERKKERKKERATTCNCYYYCRLRAPPIKLSEDVKTVR